MRLICALRRCYAVRHKIFRHNGLVAHGNTQQRKAEGLLSALYGVGDGYYNFV